MDVTIIGLGHVGLVDTVVLGSYFNNVIAFDNDKNKISLLRDGVSPIEEPFVQDLIKETKPYVRYTYNIKDAIRPNNIICIAVETSYNENGSINLDEYYESLDLIAENANKDCFVLIRSTVPPGTNRKTKEYLESKSQYKFNVITLPPFGSQGHLVESIVQPARIVIGVDSPETGRIVKSHLSSFAPKKAPVLITSPENAEMIKLASNFYIGMHISFINELSRVADLYNANIDTISQGLGYDPRINGQLLHASVGYGGLILPSSIKEDKNENFDYFTSKMFKAAVDANASQIQYFIDKIYERFRAVSAKKIAILGAAYKSGTEDIRNSPAISIMRFLLDRGAYIQLYDPLAEDKVQQFFSRHTHISYFDYAKDALKGTDFCLILTDCKEFKELKVEDFKKQMRKPIIFDGKNLYQLSEMEGSEYHSIGRRTVQLKSILDN